jgi:hypothetical protein
MWEDLLGVLRTRRSATPSDHLLAEAWQDRLPDELMSLWREVGLGPLEDGLLTLIQPDELLEEVEAWAAVTQGRSLIPFMRTAFLDLYCWDGEAVYTLDVHMAELRPTHLDMESFLMFFLPDEAVIRDVLRRPLWEQACALVGRPAADEGLIFVPALCLGGQEVAAQIRRARWREAIAVLRGLHGL